MASDNRKAEAIAQLEKAKAKWPDASQANQIKLAIGRWFMEEIGEADPQVRKDVISAFLELPSWFGASANAMKVCESYVKRTDKKSVLDDADVS
jgi:hypothetical protein